MVVTSHSAVILSAGANFGASPFGSLFQFGRSGVDFFFVLSGFLISLLHWKDIGRPDRLKRYGLRRLTRIYPTYWLILLAIAPFDYFSHTLFDHYDRIGAVVKSILLLPQADTILDVTWSLRNELLFYILFGLMIFNRTIGIIIIGLWLIGLTVRPFLPFLTFDPWLNLMTYPMNFEFLAGVAAGWAFPRITVRRPALLLAAGLIVFAGLWLAENYSDGWSRGLSEGRFLFRSLAYGVAAALTIVGLSSLELRGRIRLPQMLVTLGGASYLLYLVHVPALLILGASERHLHLLRWTPAWLLGGVFVLITIIGAVAMHMTIERPMLRAIRNWSAKLMAPPAAAPAG
jgi:peptidoglycan/LPS O-acetylase OafA/YrhL